MYYQKYNKYRNISHKYGDRIYHSKAEAGYAKELDLRLRAKDIKAWTPQFKVSLDVNGKHITNYYVDFRVTLNDDQIELVEIKGMETDTWRIKRRLLEAIYLEEHPECIYTVVKV